MNWATPAIEALRAGQEPEIRPRGHSMSGKVESGDLVKLKKVLAQDINPGDIVLVRVKGRTYLHLVKARRGNRFQIGNNRGRINGWVGPHAIYGKAIEIAGRQLK